MKESLALIEEARTRGLDVLADQYLYTAGSTGLDAFLHNRTFVADDGGIGRVMPEDVTIAGAPNQPEFEGLTMAQLNERFGTDTEATAQRVIDEAGEGTTVVLHMMAADVETVLRHETTMIGSDGLDAGTRPHPRLDGTFPRVLGLYARDLGVLLLEVAVRKMTGMPAEHFRLVDRGKVRVGAHADLVVFDPATVIDTATYAAPRQAPIGIMHVVVNGAVVVRDGVHTGARPGEILRHQATVAA